MCLRLSGDGIVEIRDEADKGLSREGYARQFLVDEVKSLEAQGAAASGKKYFGQKPKGSGIASPLSNIRLHFFVVICKLADFLDARFHAGFLRFRRLQAFL